MQASRSLRDCVLVGAAAVVSALSVSPCDAVEIRHSEGARYAADLTRAYFECTVPNDVSSDGVPACNPPITSACDYSSGRVEMSGSPPETRVQVVLTNASGPGTCETGEYDTHFALRITVDDAACATGQCTTVDAFFVVGDTGSNVSADFYIEDFLEMVIGVRPGHVANYEILDVTVSDPDGEPLAAVGVGNHDATSLQADVSARYAACTVPNTQTTDGVPACSGPTWGASCDFTAGEIQLSDDGGATPSVPTVLAEFSDASGASPLCANGTYEIVSVLRLTGPVCSGNPCTLVDTQATIAVDAVDGAILDSANLATDGLAGPFDSIEVRETFVRNPLAEAAASPAVTNAYLIEKPGVTIKLMDIGNPADDKLNVKGTFENASIDPNIGGATFSVTDQNGLVYAVTIPAGSWEELRPGVWSYKDDTASLGGVTKASIKGGTKFKLKAQDLMLAAADLPTVSLAFSVSSIDVPTTHAMRNARCADKPTGRKCRL
jgi:hypothetical protein